MMRSARERPEAESRLQKVAPPRVRKSRHEVTVSAPLRASVGSVHQFKLESGESEEELEEKKDPEPKGVLIRYNRFSSQVTCASPCARPYLIDTDSDTGERRACGG